jgi:hypothetical protein
MQAEAAGAVLGATGHLERLDLVVVSPFRRTLETAAVLLACAENAGHATPTIVSPLAAEHTLLRSGVQQGDRGSTGAPRARCVAWAGQFVRTGCFRSSNLLCWAAAELREAFPEAEYPQFDFSTVDQYCEERSIEGGKWWHHAATDEDQVMLPHETHDSFEASTCTTSAAVPQHM